MGGRVIASTDEAGQLVSRVPGKKGRYTLTTVQSRTPDSEVTSRRVWTRWTFASGHRAQGPLPITAMQILPPVDLRGRTHKRPHRLRVVARSQPGSGAPALAHLQVRLSFNHGKTWHLVRSRQVSRSSWSVAVRPPAFGTTVSVRVDGADNLGNRVRHRIADAYRLPESP